MEQATKDIKEKFENACNTANDNFSKTIEKSGKELTTKMEADINKAREATVKEIEKASGIIAGFKTVVDELKEGYNKSLTESSENQKTVMTQIATDFSKSADQYIDSMKRVKTEMESLFEKYNNLTIRIEDVLKEVQGSIESALAHFSRAVDSNTQATVALGQNLESQISSSFFATNGCKQKIAQVDIDTSGRSDNINNTEYLSCCKGNINEVLYSTRYIRQHGRS